MRWQGCPGKQQNGASCWSTTARPTSWTAVTNSWFKGGRVIPSAESSLLPQTLHPKDNFSEKYHLHSHSGFHTPVTNVSEIRAVHKINQQELALKQLISLNIAPYTSNTNLFCRLLQKFFRQTKIFYACVRDLVFVGVGLLCLKESVFSITFTVYPLNHHFCLFPQFPKFIQK